MTEQRKAYMRQWRRDNRLTIQDYQRNYRAENWERLRQYNREWRQANRDKVAQSQAKYWARLAAEQAQSKNGGNSFDG